jgi:GNAT superfamily N-acetyltransferase
MTSGPPLLPIDADALHALEREHSRSDLLVGVAHPAEFGLVERLSRSASGDEVRSPLTESLIRWFVDESPAGPGFVVVARNPASGDLAGHFVFYRWTLARRRSSGDVEDLPAFLYVRLYVDPRHRRRGVFSAMARFGLGLVERLGVGFAYTAPNPRSGAGFTRFGIASTPPLPFRVRPAWRAWGLLRGAAGRARGVEVQRREAFDDAFAAALPAALPPSVCLWTPRDAARLNWRYVSRPDIDYEIRYLRDAGRPVGYLVTRRMVIKGLSALVVCDAWVEPGAAWALRAGVDDALRSGARVRVAIAIGGGAVPDLRRAFRAAGFLRCPTPLLPQPVALFGGGVGVAPVRTELPDVAAWHVMPCDWDVF